MTTRDLEVRPITHANERDRRDVASLLTIVLGAPRTWEDIERRTRTEAGDALFVGAFSRGELVGFLACLRRDLVERGLRVAAAQATRVVVAPHADSQEVSAALLQKAGDSLTSSGAAFLFSLVAPAEQAAFRAGGFRDRGRFLESIVPRGRLGAMLSLSRLGLDDFVIIDDGFRQDDAHLLAAQRGVDRDVDSFTFDGNIIWGKPVTHGRLRGFDVRGIIAGDARHFSRAIASALGRTSSVYARFHFHESSGFRRLFRHPRPAAVGTRLFVRDLARATTDVAAFHFAGGLAHEY